jgi:hypothetical protein
MKQAYVKRFGCDACIPLGLLGHELDTASQQQNFKIINETLASAQFDATATLASSYVKVSEGIVSASCQIFGKTAFLSFTWRLKPLKTYPKNWALWFRKKLLNSA